MTQPATTQPQSHMDRYWLWKRLNWRNHSYRYFYLDKMISAREMPQWVTSKFQELSNHNIVKERRDV